MGDLRCPNNRLHGVLRNGLLEVKCDNKWCTNRKRLVVLHYFDVKTEQMVKTVKYKNPAISKRDNPLTSRQANRLLTNEYDNSTIKERQQR